MHTDIILDWKKGGTQRRKKTNPTAMVFHKKSLLTTHFQIQVILQKPYQFWVPMICTVHRCDG